MTEINVLQWSLQRHNCFYWQEWLSIPWFIFLNNVHLFDWKNHGNTSVFWHFPKKPERSQLSLYFEADVICFYIPAHFTSFRAKPFYIMRWIDKTNGNGRTQNSQNLCTLANSTQTFSLVLVEWFLFLKKSHLLGFHVIFSYLRGTTLKEETMLTYTLHLIKHFSLNNQCPINPHWFKCLKHPETSHSTWLCYILSTFMKSRLADCKFLKEGTQHLIFNTSHRSWYFLALTQHTSHLSVRAFKQTGHTVCS